MRRCCGALALRAVRVDVRARVRVCAGVFACASCSRVQMFLSATRRQLLEELVASVGFLGDSQSLNETSRLSGLL